MSRPSCRSTIPPDDATTSTRHASRSRCASTESTPSGTASRRASGSSGRHSRARTRSFSRRSAQCLRNPTMSRHRPDRSRRRWKAIRRSAPSRRPTCMRTGIPTMPSSPFLSRRMAPRREMPARARCAPSPICPSGTPMTKSGSATSRTAFFPMCTSAMCPQSTPRCGMSPFKAALYRDAAAAGRK